MEIKTTCDHCGSRQDRPLSKVKKTMHIRCSSCGGNYSVKFGDVLEAVDELDNRLLRLESEKDPTDGKP